MHRTRIFEYGSELSYFQSIDERIPRLTMKGLHTEKNDSEIEDPGAS